MTIHPLMTLNISDITDQLVNVAKTTLDDRPGTPPSTIYELLVDSEEMEDAKESLEKMLMDRVFTQLEEEGVL